MGISQHAIPYHAAMTCHNNASLKLTVGIGVMGEQASLRLIAGVAAVIVGVYIASTADSPEGGGGGGGKSEGGEIAMGYALAVGHLIFDTVGASITKRCSGGLGPLQIGESKPCALQLRHGLRAVRTPNTNPPTHSRTVQPTHPTHSRIRRVSVPRTRQVRGGCYHAEPYFPHRPRRVDGGQRWRGWWFDGGDEQTKIGIGVVAADAIWYDSDQLALHHWGYLLRHLRGTSVGEL